MYMFVLMAFTCLYKYLGSGPMWPSSITTAEACRTSWWTNLLYVNNLVDLDDQVCSSITLVESCKKSRWTTLFYVNKLVDLVN